MTRLTIVFVFAALGILGGDGSLPSTAQAVFAQERASAINLRESSLRRAATVSPTPEYPRASLVKKTGGVAVAAVSIGLDGKVERVDILEAPDQDIETSVQAAVSRWIVPWQSGPAGEPARRRTGKLTFYFRVVAGAGRVFNPEEMPGGARAPEERRSTVPAGQGSSPPPHAPGAAAAPSSKTITVTDMQKLPADRRPLVLDVGTREAFKRDHWPGAVNIPVDELPVRGGIELAEAAAVAIDCTRDQMWRCQAAASMLAQRGLTNVLVMVR